MSARRLVTGGHQGAKPATAARIYDYFLDGTHNFPADREAANAIIAMFPATRSIAQVNRAFLRRAVKYLCAQGITQFLDIGSGVPTVGNVHEVAQQINPQARVIYVDIDPVAVAESQEMLHGNHLATAIQGDARDPRAILDHPQVRAMLDFDTPVAVLLVAVLHFVDDDAELGELVRQLLEGVPPGSYLVISHAIDETPSRFDGAADAVANDAADDGAADLRRVREVYQRRTSAVLTMRTRAQVSTLFTGLTVVDPGVVWLRDWRPDPDDPGADPEVDYRIATGGIAGGVGGPTGQYRPAQAPARQ